MVHFYIYGQEKTGEKKISLNFRVYPYHRDSTVLGEMVFADEFLVWPCVNKAVATEGQVRALIGVASGWPGHVQINGNLCKNMLRTGTTVKTLAGHWMPVTQSDFNVPGSEFVCFSHLSKLGVWRLTVLHQWHHSYIKGFLNYFSAKFWLVNRFFFSNWQQFFQTFSLISSSSEVNGYFNIKLDWGC